MRSHHLSALIGVLSLAGAAWPVDGKAAEVAAPASEGFVTVCKADIERLCVDTPPGNAAIAQCLGKQKSQIGKRCLAALRHAKRVSMFRAACGGDTVRLCAGVQPGKGRILQCLSAHQEDLSADCKARVARRLARAGGADAAVADQAAIEQQEDVEPVPPSVPVKEEASGAAPGSPADVPVPTSP
jgi:hypothetical protein